MNLSIADIAWLTAFPCLMAAAQLLFKSTANRARGMGIVSALPLFLRHAGFYAALAAYGAATLLWLWLLSRYTLALAYPFTAVAFLLVPLLEAAFYGVRTNLVYWAGLVLIVAGAIVVARSQHG